MAYHLLSWGANSHGQLGQGIQSEECKTPQKVDLSGCRLHSQSIKKIAGGAGHTLILDNEGRVYSCGWNNKGQTGLPDNSRSFFFQEVGGDLRNKLVKDIACGWDSSAALTEDGVLYAWGSNNYGQLGRDPGVLQWTHDPFPVLADRKIKRISMGLRHTALISEDHIVLVAGSGSKGQLGLAPSRDDDPPNNIYTFTEVPEIKNAVDVVCGQHHTVVATKEQYLYVFGDNKHGQLGLDPKTLSRTARPIKALTEHFQEEIKLHTGWSHTSILTAGEVFSWGRNTYGQLGCPQERRIASWQIKQMENIPKIRQMATGSEHTIALTEDNSIVCWGWNEHGNCGTGHTKDVLSPEKLPLDCECIPILVGTGAGHSLAVIKAL